MRPDYFDVVIIGGGPAGISCALWCRELGLDAVLLESGAGLGGQLNWTFNRIENHLGAHAEDGRHLLQKFLKQVEGRKLDIRPDTKITEIDFENCRLVSSGGVRFAFRFLVLATGVRRRRLGIPGEEEFAGKGILVSGKRDFGLAKGKTAVVVGGGDAAFENALILAESASKVILVHRSDQFRARREFIDRVKAARNVEILTGRVLTRFGGAQRIESVEVRDRKTGLAEEFRADFVISRIGVEPNTDFLGGKIKLDPDGYVVTDVYGRTNLENIFAAGDVANPVSPTISSAVGMGATVAKFISLRD